MGKAGREAMKNLLWAVSILTVLIEKHKPAFLGLCKFSCIRIVTFGLIYTDGYRRACIRFDIVGKLSINFALVFRRFVRAALHYSGFSNMKDLEIRIPLSAEWRVLKNPITQFRCVLEKRLSKFRRYVCTS